MKFKNPILNNKLQNRIAKKMVDGILNVVKRIAGQAQLTTFDEVYDFVLNMDPDEFAAYQISSSDQVVLIDPSSNSSGFYRDGDRLSFKLKGEENELSD